MNVNTQCLCGSVAIEAELSSTEVAACHCSMCRKWAGGPMLAIDCGGSVKFKNESLVTRYPSSDWADRGFCSKCGTHLFYYLKSANQYHLPAGLMETDADYALTHQIFIDEKPAYYSFSNETKNMTGAEVFAEFENNQ